MTEKFMDSLPEIASGAWVHPSAVVIGKVRIADGVSVWPGAVVRGDVDSIEIGAGTNIQDVAVLHPNQGKPVLLGENITVGHSAIIHGSVIGSHCLIGMGSVVIDCEVGEYSVVAAGAVVPPGAKIPPRSMVMGTPGKVKRQLTDEECAGLEKSAKDYAALASYYRGGEEQ